MAKTNITQYSTTPSSNTDINSINIDENCPASGLNNAIRELMAHLKNVDTGSQALTALSVTGDTTISSGNLLVGKTSTGLSNVGFQVLPSGVVGITRSGSNPLDLNRLSSDGNLIEFNKDGTTVGSIASRAGSVSTIILDPSATGGGISGGGAALYPTDHAGTLSDGALTLGDASYRWNNLYLSGGVYLGGTGSANYLDDYEEGNFTPTLGSSGNRVGTWTSTIGKYTKVGNKVTLHISITGTGMRFSSTNGYQAITGLPFSALQPSNSQNYAGAWSGGAVEYSSGGSVYLYASTMYLHNSNPNQASAGVASIGVGITYFTA